MIIFLLSSNKYIIRFFFIQDQQYQQNNIIQYISVVLSITRQIFMSYPFNNNQFQSEQNLEKLNKFTQLLSHFQEQKNCNKHKDRFPLPSPNKINLLIRNNSVQIDLINRKKKYSTCYPLNYIEKADRPSITKSQSMKDKLSIYSSEKILTRIISKNELQYQQKIYQWRQQTNFPVLRVQIIKTNDYSLQRVQNPQEIIYFPQIIELQLQVDQGQEVLFTLETLVHINLLNCIYILNQSIVCFQRLFSRFGYFQLTQKMIFITKEHKCKVWINQNILLNKPQINKIKEKKQKNSKNEENTFYQNLVKFFSDYFNKKLTMNKKNGQNILLFNKFIIDFEATTNFVQGLKFINEFVSLHHLIVIKRLILSDKEQIIEKSVSKKLKFESNLKNDLYSIEKTWKNEKNHQTIGKNSNIQTLKYSIEPINEGKISKCRTINKKSQFYHYNYEVDNSIYSKKTINDKKSWFSIEDQTIPLRESEFNQTNSCSDEKHIKQKNQSDMLNILSEEFIESSGTEFRSRKHLNYKEEQEYESRIKNQIQSRIRKQNGWLLNPYFILENTQCTKSFQDGEIPLNLDIRDRALTKLNKIKGSIVNSIMEESIV